MTPPKISTTLLRSERRSTLAAGIHEPSRFLQDISGVLMLVQGKHSTRAAIPA
jgi:hypothetical protein